MSSLTVDLTGVAQLVATAADVAAGIDDLTAPNQAAARHVEARIDPPILTGRLAATVSVTADDGGVLVTAGGTGAPYAAVVHARNPFLTRALTASLVDVEETYADHVDDHLTRLRGA